MRPARVSDLVALDPTTTLLVIDGSGSKIQDSPAGLGSGVVLWALESDPDDVATRLRAARADVRRHVVFDERTLIPALNRSSGAFYLAGSVELAGHFCMGCTC
jgi:hypothetical protein